MSLFAFNGRSSCPYRRTRGHGMSTLPAVNWRVRLWGAPGWRGVSRSRWRSIAGRAATTAWGPFVSPRVTGGRAAARADLDGVWSRCRGGADSRSPTARAPSAGSLVAGGRRGGSCRPTRRRPGRRGEPCRSTRRGCGACRYRAGGGAARTCRRPQRSMQPLNCRSPLNCRQPKSPASSCPRGASR